MLSASFDALTGEQIVQSNSLATLTENCVVVRASSGLSQSIFSLSRLSEVKSVKVTHSNLLVIAAGLGVLSAAAFSSKQGDGAGTPLAVAAVIFLIAYGVTRRAYLIFVVGHEETATQLGTLSEAAILIKRITSAQKKQNEAIPDLSAPATY